MKYYLAYGSNLHKEEMAKRCPQASVVGVSEIADYELLYKGECKKAYLTIEACRGASVPVGVWQVSDEDIAFLDEYEDFPQLYYKKDIELSVICADGQTRILPCFVYIMHEENKIALPDQSYVDVCMQGYDDFGFDKAILKEAFPKM